MSEMSPDSDPDVQQEQEQEQQQQEDEAARQAADTIRSISRLEESN